MCCKKRDKQNSEILALPLSFARRAMCLTSALRFLSEVDTGQRNYMMNSELCAHSFHALPSARILLSVIVRHSRVIYRAQLVSVSVSSK